MSCKRCLDVFGVSLKAPDITARITDEYIERYALSINAETIAEPHQIQAGKKIHSNITQPIIDQEVTGIPLLGELADNEERLVYEAMMYAAKVPSSFPYRSDCGARRPLPPSSSVVPEACDPLKAELSSAYRLFITRRLNNLSEPELRSTVNGYFHALQSRAIRIDGRQSLVTYVIKPGAGDAPNWWKFISGPPPPWDDPRQAAEPFATGAWPYNHGTHIQVGVQGGVVRKISVSRMERFGEEDWNVAFDGMAPRRQAFWSAYLTIPSVNEDARSPIGQTLKAPACHCVYCGKDYYFTSSYDPSKSLTFSSDWKVARLNYETLEAYGSQEVSNFACDGDWKIILPSCRAYLLTDPPPAKDLSEWFGAGATGPAVRLPDEPWVCAIHSSNTKLVTGRALNSRLRTQGSWIDEWDGTLDENEIENVVVWNTFSAAVLAEAGLPSNYQITEIRVRAYQHINGKDYLIFTVPGPPRYVDFTAKFESDDFARIAFNEETGFDRVRPPGVPNLNFGMPTGIEFVFRTVGPGDHRWEIDQPLRFQQPQWPYVEADKTRYEMCSMDGQGNPSDPCNLDQLAFLHNRWSGPATQDTEAVLKLYVDLGEDATIDFDWRFENRSPGESPPFHPATNLPDPDTWLEFRMNGAVATGDWTCNGTVYDDAPFHIDHVDDSYTPETYETYSQFTKTGIAAGSYLLELVVHTGSVDPLTGQPTGHAFIDSIHVTKARLPDDEDAHIPFLFNGDEVHYIDLRPWVYRDQEQDPMPEEASRTKRVPDYITVEDPSDISGEPQKILYGNSHYTARVNPDGSPDTTFHNSLDLREQDQLKEEFGGVKKGVVRFTPSPGQVKIFQPCDDTNETWAVVGDPIADPPWGAFEILTGKHKTIQLRGVNGSFRDASDVDLLPVRIDHTLPPFGLDETTVPPTSYETHGLASLPGWEGYRWLPMLRGGPWTKRATGWTIDEDGRKLIPHLEILWAPYFDLPSWPTDQWPDPPYPSASIWYWNRPRDPRRLPPWQAIEGNPPNEEYVPIHWSQNNYIIPRSYTDALSHLPQFTWAKAHPDAPDDSLTGWPWELVPAWHTPLAARYVIGVTWDVFHTMLTWQDTDRCDPESSVTRRTTTLRPFPKHDYSIPGPAWTDFDAADCDCCD